MINILLTIFATLGTLSVIGIVVFAVLICRQIDKLSQSMDNLLEEFDNERRK